MKGPLNPDLNVGDVIMLLHMEKETAVPPGTIGVVTKISRDPFESPEERIISVKWENGSNLGLITSTDAWKKVKSEENIKEQRDSGWEYMTQNADVFENFDWRWLEQFLYKIRDSGIINMYSAYPLLYAGSEHIDRYYGEGREDDEDFQAVLEDAEESKHKIIQGVIKYMEKNDKDLDNIGQVNRYAQHFAQKILGLYIVLSSMRNRN